jgi:hypothetical protein
MIYSFEENEFTSWELLQYLKKAYGHQLNGAPFTATNVCNWRREGKLPDLYGGYKIVAENRYKELGNLLVITLDGFTRTMMEQMVGDPLADMAETVNRQRKADVVPKAKRPRKQRTKLYYSLLPKSKQTTKATLSDSTLPNYWKEAGGKRNQIVKGRKRQINSKTTNE